MAFCVADVYDQLSHHFSEERYRPWPRVRQFLEQLEPGSLVCDAGTVFINAQFNHIISSRVYNLHFPFAVLVVLQAAATANTSKSTHPSSNWARIAAPPPSKLPVARITRYKHLRYTCSAQLNGTCLWRTSSESTRD